MFVLAFFFIFIIFSHGKTHHGKGSSRAGERDWSLFLSVARENERPPKYDITQWVQRLHLQQCAFVEIGEGFCALFVELRSIPSAAKLADSSGVGEFFLGLCDCATLRTWALCSDALTGRRRSDCIFTEATATANSSARVHRRLCDVTLLGANAPSCNCSVPMAGFPTCFRNPLPKSLCSPRGVCGVAQCTAATVRGIHSPRCDPNCHQRQPFCEELGPWTSVPPTVDSRWSRWSAPRCNNTCGKGLMIATTVCHDQVTGKPALDCIGPGSFCCPPEIERCGCEVTLSAGVMTATRYTEPCTSIVGCSARRVERQSVREGDSNGDGESFDDFYEDAERSDQDNLEDLVEYYSEYEEPFDPIQRRLMTSDYYRDNDDEDAPRDREFELEFAEGDRRDEERGASVNDDFDDDYEDYEDYEEEDEDEGGDFEEAIEEDLNGTDSSLDSSDYADTTTEEDDADEEDLGARPFGKPWDDDDYGTNLANEARVQSGASVSGVLSVLLVSLCLG